MKTTGKIMIVALALISLITACNKDGGTSRMYVKMKDAPGDFQQVNVEVIGVEVHYSNDSEGNEGWVSLPTNAGVYDLIQLQNNITAVLTDPTDIPAGSVTQMRLILGANNSVMVDSTVLFLATPSAQNTGLKFNLNTNFHEDHSYEVLIDFDAAASIVLEGNGSFSLKPVIKVESITEL